MFQTLYRSLSVIATPALAFLPKWRAKHGKEISSRLNERFGVSDCVRPNGKLIWIHGASNGEILSIIPLLNYLKSLPSAPHILITTMTVTAAQLLEKRLEKHDYIHQFIPYDHPQWIAKFHDHWQPDMAIWVESELWPNHLSTLKKRKIPSVLLNARLSQSSAKKWAFFRKTFQSITSCFDVILAQSEPDLDRLKSLGLDHIQSAGNLKDIAPALPFDPVAADDIRHAIESRPCILFASTHAPEESMVADIHANLKKDHPELLSIIIPRHPKRGETIAHDLNKHDLNIALRSLRMSPRPTTDIYIADTIGEMGLFYHLCPIVYVGNSIGTAPGGGHNLHEPAWHGCTIISGDSLFNFSDQAENMPTSGAAILVKNKDDLIQNLKQLLSNESKCQTMAENAYDYVAKKQAVGLDKITNHLEPVCKKAKLL
jgi:3-deoxy-D-manno-octulosonic-acid transferase